MIRILEERSINALPALQTILYDGWILRFANGHTRRANSVNPLYPSALPIDEKVAVCEEHYRRRGRPTIFKLTTAALPADLDARLGAHGYQVTEEVIVQTSALASLALPEPSADLVIGSALTDDWLADYVRISADIDPSRASTLNQMLRGLAPTAAFAALRRDGVTLAIGLGVLECGYLGLFDITVDPTARRQGHGLALVGGLLAWGKRQGAATAYLQVVVENHAAQQLYARLGFREHHRYWYRTRSNP